MNVFNIEIFLFCRVQRKKRGELEKKKALCMNGHVKIPKQEFWNYP